MDNQKLADPKVDYQTQLDLVKKYYELREVGDIPGVLGIVTEDIMFDAAGKLSFKGKRVFKEYLSNKDNKPEKVGPVEMKNGIAQCSGKFKLLLIRISFTVQFEIVHDPATNRPLIKKVTFASSSPLIKAIPSSR